eukprot:scaffold28403_cov112-Isochrysis_galbana.AAC.1
MARSKSTADFTSVARELAALAQPEKWVLLDAESANAAELIRGRLPRHADLGVDPLVVRVVIERVHLAVGLDVEEGVVHVRDLIELHVMWVKAAAVDGPVGKDGGGGDAATPGGNAEGGVVRGGGDGLGEVARGGGDGLGEVARGGGGSAWAVPMHAGV